MVNHIGKTINNDIANKIENKVVIASRSLEKKLSLFSSGYVISADHCNVSIPIFIASYNDAMPLNIGIDHIAEFSVIDLNF